MRYPPSRYNRPDVHTGYYRQNIVHGFEVGERITFCNRKIGPKMTALSYTYVAEAGSTGRACLKPRERWCAHCQKTPEFGLILLAACE